MWNIIISLQFSYRTVEGTRTVTKTDKKTGTIKCGRKKIRNKTNQYHNTGNAEGKSRKNEYQTTGSAEERKSQKSKSVPPTLIFFVRLETHAMRMNVWKIVRNSNTVSISHNFVLCLSRKTTAVVICDTHTSTACGRKPQFLFNTPPFNTSREIASATSRYRITPIMQVRSLFYTFHISPQQEGTTSAVLHNAVTITSPLKVSSIYKLQNRLQAPWWEGECSQFKL